VVAWLAESPAGARAVLAEDPWVAFGVNTLSELAEAGRRLRERRNAALMEQGVALEHPESTSISFDAVVEPGARIRASTILEGRCRVAAGASVGPFCRLVNTSVAADASILDHCLLLDSEVGAGASVGPFAHVRPQTRIGDRARVGNFVELKKTQLGEGSKANHLAYLGDSTIAGGVNVGAGTITCNYDGHAKHPTQIEAGAFVGSNSTLVAPVRIGSGAYVAAGSVITKDVPEDALGLGRSRQTHKDGWARKMRERRQRQRRS
jgi:bifunctional UDP-N-acetylglucosamine pyrophosphorylase/glucosamine-1-phosphate N-acetyltransferase